MVLDAPLRRLTARFGYPKARRVRRRAEYLSIQRAGKKLHSPHLVFLFTRAASSTGNGPRLGVTLTKKIGNAVTRNRVRRLCREIFRAAQHAIPANVDLVLIPKDRAVRVGFFELQQEFQELCRRAF